MRDLKNLLETKKEGLLNIYCTAGYPKLNDLPIIVNALHKAGVDMVEIEFLIRILLLMEKPYKKVIK